MILFCTARDLSEVKGIDSSFNHHSHAGKFYAKQKHLGCKKSARPIRSKMQAGRCDQKL